MATSNFNGLAHNELALDPYTDSPEISEAIQQTISRIQAWNASQNIFRFLQVNNAGQLLVSVATPAAPVVSQTHILVTDVEAGALADNPLRRAFAVQNQGINNVYISYIVGLADNRKLIVGSGSTWTDETWTGPVYVKCDLTLASDIAIWEY